MFYICTFACIWCIYNILHNWHLLHEMIWNGIIKRTGACYKTLNYKHQSINFPLPCSRLCLVAVTILDGGVVIIPMAPQMAMWWTATGDETRWTFAQEPGSETVQVILGHFSKKFDGVFMFQWIRWCLWIKYQQSYSLVIRCEAADVGPHCIEKLASSVLGAEKWIAVLGKAMCGHWLCRSRLVSSRTEPLHCYT